MTPDIQPLRLTAIDIVSLTDIEIRAALIHIAGHEDPAVAVAAVDAIRSVLRRTRDGVDIPPALK